MATENNQLTPEQEETFWTQNIESSRFLRRNKDFKIGQKNADKMAELLGSADWTAEELEKVFRANKEKFETQPIKERPVPPPPPPVEPLAPQAPEWGLITKASIGSMAPDDYKRWHNHEDEAIRTEFRKQVNNVFAGKNQFGGAI